MGAKENIAVDNNNSNNNTEPLNCILLGDTYSGKTALLVRLAYDTWHGNSLRSNNLDFKIINLKGSNVKVKIFDCPFLWYYAWSHLARSY